MLRFALKTLAESIGATYVSSALAYLAAFGLIIFTGDHRWIDAILISPTFLVPIAAGGVLAYLLRNHISKSSYFAWIVPGFLLFRAVLELVRSPDASSSETWGAILGTNCGATECFYESLFTLPFVCALSYSISSACIRGIKPNGKNRKVATLLCAAVLVVASPKCRAQAPPGQNGWGEQFNTANSKLVLKETGRSRSNGHTVVTYNLFASGLPLDVEYTLWTRLVGNKPQVAADAILNREGKLVSQLSDPEHHTVEDPIDLKVFAGKGEPKQFGLISRDGKLRSFAEVIPFPIESTDGPCHLSAVMTAPNYLGVFITITGFQSNEDLLVDTRSDHEGGQSRAKATDRGTYDSALFPSVKGLRSGTVRFSAVGKSCKVSFELPWGEGSYELR
jgi:hypothetical protein